MRVRRMIITLAVAGLAGGFGCGGGTEPTQPTAGPLDLVLSTPNNGDGAILLTVSGGAIDSVSAAGYPIHAARASGTSFRVVVTGAITDGTIARVHVPNTALAGSYAVTISDVAEAGTYALRNLAGYSVDVQ